VRAELDEEKLMGVIKIMPLLDTEEKRVVKDIHLVSPKMQVPPIILSFNRRSFLNLRKITVLEK
jgi:hypothetical protein